MFKADPKNPAISLEVLRDGQPSVTAQGHVFDGNETVYSSFDYGVVVLN